MASSSAARAINHKVASGTGMPRSRKVLLLVDFINPLDFAGADDLADAAVEAARATARLKKQFHTDGACVIYVNDNFGQWRSDVPTLLRRCRGAGGAAAELARLLPPAKADLLILKPRHSGFYATPLDLLLEQLSAKEVVVTGLATDYCVKWTAMDAYVRGYRVVVPADCTAAESEPRKRAALEWMEEALKARITP
ncbi:hypothetical protein CDL60_14140 [Roseateles noduli]|nr:hypothetical protein CDL60_14140 [Roseateles noduli]